ncbi:AI-2E family transporter [Lachnoclostridium phytofermentans]|uniref:AI-2E family transporter n=1 Tax=Lachnoclostridium phytofermentans (strain ATCC 700394 / DSM 18823 / ISDg) TaxID=357809 RepID=A9KLV8_LACP7|nr:AI-2E family transporter [Lachnoclostridium phytofermentans]ABX44267.1 protein of unknown function UPF0118 [Lachnoclostridium phytofermentans ISDg]
MAKKLKLSGINKKKKAVVHEETGKIKVIVLKEEKVSEEQEKEIVERPKDYKFRFEPTKKYFTISVYAFCVIALSIIFKLALENIPSFSTGLKNFGVVIQPFIAAFFIAFIVNPIVKALADRFYGKMLNIKKPKVCLALGIATTYIIIIAVIVVSFTYIIPQVTNSITELVLNSDALYKKGETWLNDIGEKFPILDTGYIQDKIEASLPQLLSFGTDFVKNVLPKILNVSISIAKTAINILLSIAISIYMLYDKRMLSKNAARIIYAFIPKKKADSFLDVTRECGSIFTGFIVGKTIDSTIIGILCFILMSILRLPYAILISVIVGVTNMIPYFGPFIGAVPGILLFLFISPIQALVFAIMILGLQQFDGWILGPKILGDSTGLTPLWVIFGITVGGAYGGVIGMFLGVPFVAVIAYLAGMFITGRLKKRNIEIR